MGHLTAGFTLLALGQDVPEVQGVKSICLKSAVLSAEMMERYLGDAAQAIYLIRPDQHIAARWGNEDAADVETHCA